MTIDKIPYIIDSCVSSNDVPCLVGDAGIGKTDILKKYATDNNYHMEPLLLCTQEIGDLIGTPTNVTLEDGTIIQKWSTPDWWYRLHQAKLQGKKCMLLLDELNRAQTDVKNTANSLILDKKLHQHTLPEGTLIVCAMNPDNKNYQVSKLDAALCNRLLFLYLEADTDVFLKWGKENNLHEIIDSYLRNKPSRVYHDGNGKEQVWATPRSWAKLGEHLSGFHNVPGELHYDIIKGKIGTIVGNEFYAYYLDYNTVIKLEDIVAEISNIYQNTQTKDIIECGELLKPFISDLEVAVLKDYTITLVKQCIIDKEINDPVTLSGYKITATPVFILFWALPIEVLSSVFHTLRVDEPVIYSNIAGLDSFYYKSGRKEIFFHQKA
jgi:hypothetical protein